MAGIQTDFSIGNKTVDIACKMAILYLWVTHEIVAPAVVLNPQDGKSVTEVWASVGLPTRPQKFTVERSDKVPVGTVRVRLP